MIPGVYDILSRQHLFRRLILLHFWTKIYFHIFVQRIRSKPWTHTYFFRLGMEWHSIPAGMEWGHSIPAGMEWAFHSCRNGMTPFHSCRNGTSIPFQSEWNEHFLQEWNEHFHADQKQMLMPLQTVLAPWWLGLIDAKQQTDPCWHCTADTQCNSK